jgi:hypothetical protein
MGDSAGGNLALGLARYLAELAERSTRKEVKEIGQVGGMILYSVSLRIPTFCVFGADGLVAMVRYDILIPLMHRQRQIRKSRPPFFLCFANPSYRTTPAASAQQASIPIPATSTPTSLPIRTFRLHCRPRDRGSAIWWSGASRCTSRRGLRRFCMMRMLRLRGGCGRRALMYGCGRYVWFFGMCRVC